MNSHFVEIKNIEATDKYYEIEIGLREGATVPCRDFSGTLLAPFTYESGPEMMMNEVLTFIPNPRFEVAPSRIRMRINKEDVGKERGFKMHSADGAIILKNLSASQNFEGLLVAEKDGRPLLIDPNIVNQFATSRLGQSSAFRVSLTASVYLKLELDTKLYVLFHGPKSIPDFEASWDEFRAANDIFPVSVER